MALRRAIDASPRSTLDANLFPTACALAKSHLEAVAESTSPFCSALEEACAALASCCTSRTSASMRLRRSSSARATAKIFTRSTFTSLLWLSNVIFFACNSCKGFCFVDPCCSSGVLSPPFRPRGPFVCARLSSDPSQSSPCTGTFPSQSNASFPSTMVVRRWRARALRHQLRVVLHTTQVKRWVNLEGVDPKRPSRSDRG